MQLLAWVVVRAFFTVLKENAVAVLCCKREGRFSALLDPPPILLFFFPFRGNDSAAAVEHAGVIAAPVGDPAVILGLDAPCMARQFGIAITEVNEIQPGLSAPAAGLGGHRDADAGRVVHPLALHPAYELDKSFSTARWDRKYFWSTSGSRMSASDKVDPLSVLRGAEILCIEKSVLDMVAE